MIWKNIKIDNYLEFEVNSKYEFIRCEDCNGPTLGHLQVKCPKIEYDEDVLSKFKNCLKRIWEFKEAVWAREKRKEEEDDAKEMKKEVLRAAKLVEVIKLALEKVS